MAHQASLVALAGILVAIMVINRLLSQGQRPAAGNRAEDANIGNRRPSRAAGTLDPGAPTSGLPPTSRAVRRSLSRTRPGSQTPR
ncbi:hypothetical protein ACW9KT_19865 [Hymenobacter sp. HD11105]